jgi:hypothetical protein
LRMRAPGAVPWEYSTSRATSIEFWLLNLQPEGDEPLVHTCPLPAGSCGRPHWALKAVLSLFFQAYAPAMTMVWPVPSNPAARS